ncbi:MAG TPA: hypothetical protein PLS21_07200 [Synergistales bacterium]|nr:hypothetical protein [Synergistales bacterium]
MGFIIQPMAAATKQNEPAAIYAQKYPPVESTIVPARIGPTIPPTPHAVKRIP